MTLTSNYQYIGRTNGVKARTDSWYYYVLLYAKTAGDVATGRHTVSLKMRLACDRNSSFYGYTTVGSASVDGASAISFTAVNPGGAWNSELTEGGITYPRWIDLAEGSVAVDTGWGSAKAVTLALSWQRKATSTTPPGYVPGTSVVSGSFGVTLPMLAGPSTPTLSAKTIEMGKTLTVYTNPLSAGFTHRLTYAFGNASGVIAESCGGSAQWTPPLELAQQIPSATAGIGSVYCATYQGSTLIGTASVGFTLTVPDSVKPTATMTWQDASGAKDIFGALLQNVSRLSVDVRGQGAYGSSIRSAALAIDGKAYNGGTLTKAGSQTLTATVTDSRGRTGSVSQTLSVTAYTVPTVKLQASRIPDDTGEQASVTVSGSVCDIPGNTARLLLTYGSTTEEIPVGAGAFSHTLTLDAPSVSTLSLKAELSDALCTATDAMVLSVGYATMDFLKGGRGITFGATATKEGFTCAMDAEFLGKVKGTIFDAIYPVGSIYMSVSNTDPATLFGGTWERIQDRFLLAAGSYAPGSQGGEASHTLTESELPSHIHDGITTAALANSHRMLYANAAAHATGQSAYWSLQSGTAAGNMTARTVPAGGGQPHNNLPPYLAVYIWKRSA